MSTMIAAQMTPQGLLIPRAALGDWSVEELEVVREQEAIVIRPKPTADIRPQIRHILRTAGILYEPGWETPPPVMPEERTRLAKKLASGQPLSKIIIDDREDGDPKRISSGLPE